MKLKLNEMETKLNDKELMVYNECKRIAQEYGDNGSEFVVDDMDIDIPRKVLRGYLSQLVQKGLIETLEGCYFDFIVVEFWKPY